ncbi:ATP-binding cassette domain-containing protein [Streptomyces spongiicola]|uniref:ATP-binding cassette domain-containing protein n=1 Tax=Streptomyces spongiicola TaxID=1690221 RepID=UPI0021D272BF|nr:ATP-binding cassette domain-containing protein [Streptomyces spongiicola]
MSAQVSTPIVELDAVSKRFGTHQALYEVSLTVAPGSTVGVVGESGSGKSTLARIVAGLERPDSGRVLVGGRPLPRGGRRLREARRGIGFVFQDPYASLDPRFTVEQIVGEPLRAHGLWREGGRERVLELLDAVGMGGVSPDSYPGEFSGGQRQRLCVARALAARPDLVICDEPTSALDVSVQAQILNLLQDLQDSLQVSYLFITHDLNVVRRIADEVVVVRDGRVREQGSARRVIGEPRDPYTRALLDAMPGRALLDGGGSGGTAATGPVPAPGASPAGNPVGKPAEERAGEPVVQPVGKPVEEPDGKPAGTAAL